MHPLDLLPEEMWRMILDRVDGIDKLNLIRCHQWLNDTFLHKMKECHFAVILPIVLEYFEKVPSTNWLEKYDKINEAFLACRLVSSLCCKMIDECIEDYWRRQRRPPSFTSTPIFGNALGMLNFLFKIADHPFERTPLLSREITGFCSLVPLSGSMLTSLSRTFTGEETENLLTRIGHHLWGIELTICVTENVLAFHTFFMNILSLIPNIKSLRINLNKSRYQNPNAKEEKHVNHAEDYLVIITAPLPSLPRLEKLSITDPNSTLAVDHINFRKYFSGLSVLHFDFSMWKNYQFSCNFPKLEKLTLKNISVPDGEKQLMEALRHMIAPKLEKIELLTKYKEEESLRLGSSFQAEVISTLNQRRSKSNWHSKTMLQLPLGHYYIFSDE